MIRYTIEEPKILLVEPCIKILEENKIDSLPILKAGERQMLFSESKTGTAISFISDGERKRHFSFPQEIPNGTSMHSYSESFSY